MSQRREYSRIARKLGVFIPVMIALLIAGCSTGFVPQEKEDVSAALSSISTSNGPTNGLVQSDTGGSVTIDVEWIGLKDGSLIFAVAMNTHSVDLDRYDLEGKAVLRDDEGKEYRPASWESAPGGHHRRGILTFSPPDSLIQEKAAYLELIIQGVAGVEERVFKWELG